MENGGGEGSKGSHWEKTALFTDDLGAISSRSKSFFSIFDTALLKDTHFF